MNIALINLLSTISGGGAEVAKRPTADGYFFAIAIFLVAIIAEIVIAIILALKLKKCKTMTTAVIPYALATAITPSTAKAILLVEIVVFGVLYFVNRFLWRKIKTYKNNK